MMSNRPNILLIYTDQQRYDTIAALGNPNIDTPNLDRLVTEGVAFTQATTPSPVCMPARWSLHSGQWTSTHKCYSNHHPGQIPQDNMPRMLKHAGYRTGLIGKNHSFVTSEDFDLYQQHPHSRHPTASQKRNDWLNTIGREKYPRLRKEAVPGGVQGDPQRASTDEAIDFMRASSGRPFFLWLSYLHPHTPYEISEPYFSRYINADLPDPHCEPDESYWDKKPFRQRFHRANNDAIIRFDQEDTRIMRAVYYGMISMIDAEVGRLLDFLEARQLREKTLIVFTSDHGDYQGDHSMYTKSPAMYDCLVRVPFIASWPGNVDTDRRDSRFASHIDLLPTFASAANTATPTQAEGIDLMPFLRDDGQGGPIRDAAYSEYGIPGLAYTQEEAEQEGLQAGDFNNPNGDPISWEGNPVTLRGRIRMIRTNRWKYVQESGGQNELYDLKNDPHELDNLSGQPSYRPIETELSARLKIWKKEVATRAGASVRRPSSSIRETPKNVYENETRNL